MDGFGDTVEEIEVEGYRVVDEDKDELSGGGVVS